MRIFIVNGAPKSGKTTFELFCKKYLGEDNCHIISTIDFVKEVATFCGWDGKKTSINRKFLSDLKQLLSNWNNIPNRKIIDQIIEIGKQNKEAIIFIDCREPDEIEDLCDRIKATTVLIRNTKAEEVPTSNNSDQNILDYAYDYIIDNNSTLDELQQSVKLFLNDNCL